MFNQKSIINIEVTAMLRSREINEVGNCLIEKTYTKVTYFVNLMINFLNY